MAESVTKRRKADKRRAVETFLSDPANASMSDRGAAAALGVGYTLVADVRRAMKATEPPPDVETTREEASEVESLKARVAKLEAMLSAKEQTEPPAEIAPEPPRIYSPYPDKASPDTKAAMTAEEQEAEMERRRQRVQAEIERRHNPHSKARFHKLTTTNAALARMSRIELEDHAAEIGIRPADLMLDDERLRTNIKQFQSSWLEAFNDE